MSARAVNTTLLVLVTAQWLSGFGSFLAGASAGRWTVWLHAVGGCAIAVLLIWKSRIIVRSLARHGLGLWAMPSLLLLLLLLAALITGVLWSAVGLPSLLGSSGLTWHVGLSLLMLPLFAEHVWKMRPRPQPRDYLRRRLFLRRGALVAGGVLLWRGVETTADVAALPGADRRFTGSRDAGGSGADFPRTSWLFDDPEPLDPTSWRLVVDGEVRTPLRLSLDDLPARSSREAVIDCTGGWYARRTWHGIPLTALLDDAATKTSARSVVVRSTTGYSRRFSLGVARTALLAGTVDHDPLGHGHGAPLRLVVPGHRGYDWVKWVTHVEVSPIPSWWNWPLPIR
jgi:hypothetical protein